MFFHFTKAANIRSNYFDQFKLTHFLNRKLSHQMRCLHDQISLKQLASWFFLYNIPSLIEKVSLEEIVPVTTITAIISKRKKERNRSSRPDMYYKTGFLKNFAKFAESCLYRSLLFTKVTGLQP